MLTINLPKTFKVKYLLIALALFYLILVLLLPAIAVFYEAFHKGVEPFIQAMGDRNFQSALQLTVVMALISVPLNTVFGLCAAWVLARNQFPGRALFLSVLDLPFSISPVVAGLMIVLLYGKNGWIGSWFASWDIQIIFSVPGMAIATIFVTLPFVAREVIPVLEELGPEQEEAARTLGAKDWQIFWRVTLPNIRWGLLYGVLLTNARAMGEFGAVAVVSGSILGKTSTLPIFVEQEYKNYQTEAAFGAAVVLALLAVVTLVLKEILEQRTGHHKAV
ncbi:sulfate transport system permease protein [Synechocystis sp. PCC 6803]|uniref:Sulfate transport system permease protein CysW n=1 Tax=Synechocystis sp. (strain ATCC 27184 / PCC 6803 / Kazusa) TaxID=1111708 RepID=CYSW_SYNY3|nr:MULTISPECIES: sulfate ABC transporter permease subunit CysW [unclassified Synechocystis]P74547.1 RecName: Full=Sulfate transport system permease protein CysW [Synechocystis sp. PCC 6803 substr. Kazusa]BAM53484.1 sulfate ABC transporter permease [Synechocystis sp. PCC 6803] [Bacillus subtilis BEST7613]AGF53204.1 sulfate transport system permease protein [Synechocystis sp. PCC 6803]ALJ69078.1 sulfate transporter permease CysW [Synechocystis sp. PCC 6803]AVP90944.1 sulfate ABC transporter perm